MPPRRQDGMRARRYAARTEGVLLDPAKPSIFWGPQPSCRWRGLAGSLSAARRQRDRSASLIRPREPAWRPSGLQKEPSQRQHRPTHAHAHPLKRGVLVCAPRARRTCAGFVRACAFVRRPSFCPLQDPDVILPDLNYSSVLQRIGRPLKRHPLRVVVPSADLLCNGVLFPCFGRHNPRTGRNVI